MSQSTVVERKQAFLRQQKQILAKGITPSRRLLEIADEGSIQTKVLGDVMLKGTVHFISSEFFCRKLCSRYMIVFGWLRFPRRYGGLEQAGCKKR